MKNTARPLRGGSWRDTQSLGRAPTRVGFIPEIRLLDIGFRVLKRRKP